MQLDLLMPPPLAIVAAHPEQFTEDFAEWLPENLHVFNAFEAEALKVIRRGFKHYSSKTIVHVLRHHSAVHEVGGDGWKINNNHSPYLARLFDLLHPAHAGLWEYRETKATSRSGEAA